MHRSADFASRDAQMFADYAREKLGIPDGNIKILTDTEAEETAILRALKVWLPKAVKPDTTDLYVFYAGHGMPTADGTSAYLVPYDGDIQLLEDTAISRKRFFDEISATKPRSATLFFDNCFSGQRDPSNNCWHHVLSASRLKRPTYPTTTSSSRQGRPDCRCRA